MTLRPITPLSFPDIEPGGADMPRPRYEEVDPTALLVDDAYQRNLSDRSRSLIRRIIAGWDWRAFKPPVVVKTETGLHVVDGQHTAIAAASHPAVGSIPIQIVQAAATEERAGAFVKLNRDRIGITPAQLHHAMVAAGDDDAVTLQQVCDRAGVRLLKMPPGAAGSFLPGDCQSITTIRTLVNRRHAMGARRVLDICVAARLAPISQSAIKAVEFLLFEPEYKDQLDTEDLATTLRDPESERLAKIFSATPGRRAMDVERRLEVIERENETLRERVRQLELVLTGESLLPFEWGLTRCEAKVFGVLLGRELATRDAIMAALYQDLGRDEAEPKIIDVFICRIRRKLKPFGISIRSIWGVGYQLDPAQRSELTRQGTANWRAAA